MSVEDEVVRFIVGLAVWILKRTEIKRQIRRVTEVGHEGEIIGTGALIQNVEHGEVRARLGRHGIIVNHVVHVKLAWTELRLLSPIKRDGYLGSIYVRNRFMYIREKI